MQERAKENRGEEHERSFRYYGTTGCDHKHSDNDQHANDFSNFHIGHHSPGHVPPDFLYLYQHYHRGERHSNNRGRKAANHCERPGEKGNEHWWETGRCCENQCPEFATVEPAALPAPSDSSVNVRWSADHSIVRTLGVALCSIRSGQQYFQRDERHHQFNHDIATHQTTESTAATAAIATAAAAATAAANDNGQPGWKEHLAGYCYKATTVSTAARAAWKDFASLSDQTSQLWTNQIASHGSRASGSDDIHQTVVTI